MIGQYIQCIHRAPRTRPTDGVKVTHALIADGPRPCLPGGGESVRSPSCGSTTLGPLGSPRDRFTGEGRIVEDRGLGLAPQQAVLQLASVRARDDRVHHRRRMDQLRSTGTLSGPSLRNTDRRVGTPRLADQGRPTATVPRGRLGRAPRRPVGSKGSPDEHPDRTPCPGKGVRSRDRASVPVRLAGRNRPHGIAAARTTVVEGGPRPSKPRSRAPKG